MLDVQEIAVIVRRAEKLVERRGLGITDAGVSGYEWRVLMGKVERHCRDIAEERERLAAMVVEPVALIGKICPDCKEDKPLTLTHWHRRSSSPDGHSYRCKVCKRKYDRAKARMR